MEFHPIYGIAPKRKKYLISSRKWLNLKWRLAVGRKEQERDEYKSLLNAVAGHRLNAGVLIFLITRYTRKTGLPSSTVYVMVLLAVSRAQRADMKQSLAAYHDGAVMMRRRRPTSRSGFQSTEES